MSILLRTYLRLLEKKPLVTQAISTGVLMAAGDGISQVFIEKKSLANYDRSRAFRFFVFGTVLAGPTLRGWYVFLDKFIQGTPKMRMLKMLALDQTTMGPGFLVVFIGTMDFWKNKSIPHAQAKIKENFFPVLMANYKLWPAAQVINFYFVPLQFRVIYVQCVAIIWNTYLAYRTESVNHSQVTGYTEPINDKL